MPKVKFNICNAHVAEKNIDETGKITFGTPEAVPGSVSVSLEAKGEISPFYADGIIYYKSTSNSGYDGDWELAHVPDSFREKILKEVMDAMKVLVEKTNVEGKEFAFGFQIDGDTKNTRFWFYNCTATRPTTTGKTNEDKKEPQTETLKISATPEKVVEGDDDYYVRAKTTDEVDKSTYDDWFKQVYIPQFTTAGETEKTE